MSCGSMPVALLIPAARKHTLQGRNVTCIQSRQLVTNEQRSGARSQRLVAKSWTGLLKFFISICHHATSTSLNKEKLGPFALFQHCNSSVLVENPSQIHKLAAKFRFNTGLSYSGSEEPGRAA